MAFNNLTKTGQRAQRKTLITVAEWTGAAHDVYTLTTSQPADWATTYDDYYTYTGGEYVQVTGETAPTWAANTYYAKSTSTTYRQILGTRTEDSQIDTNPDIETSTDILGVTWTDVNKTEPQQAFDPFLVLGGSKLGALLNDIRSRNALSELSQFKAYIITAFIGNKNDGYAAELHEGCTIEYTSFGGDANVNFPITLHLSNYANGVAQPQRGTVDKLTDDFVFTPDATI